MNIARQIIEQYTVPDGHDYRYRAIVQAGAVLSAQAIPTLELSVERIFGH